MNRSLTGAFDESNNKEMFLFGKTSVVFPWRSIFFFFFGQGFTKGARAIKKLASHHGLVVLAAEVAVARSRSLNCSRFASHSLIRIGFPADG